MKRTTLMNCMEGNDMDDQPTLIIKLPQAHAYDQLL